MADDAQSAAFSGSQESSAVNVHTWMSADMRARGSVLPKGPVAAAPFKNLRRDPNCPMCGDHPTIHKLIDYEEFCGVVSEEAADAFRQAGLPWARYLISAGAVGRLSAIMP